MRALAVIACVVALALLVGCVEWSAWPDEAGRQLEH